MNKPRDTWPNSANRFMVFSEQVGVEATTCTREMAVGTLLAIRQHRECWLFYADWDDEECCEAWHLDKTI